LLSTLPEEEKHWSLDTLRDRLVKIGGRIARDCRSIAFQMAEAMVPRALFQQFVGASRRCGRRHDDDVNQSEIGDDGREGKRCICVAAGRGDLGSKAES